MPEVALKPKAIHWTALVLLVISVCINYADRGNLSVAAHSIETDLHVTQQQLGTLLSGFFWTYALFQLVAGKIIDKFNVLWVLAGGYLLWSCATAATGLGTGIASIFAFRLLLGIGESIAYPAYSKIIAESFPEGLRGAANGMIDAGSKMGPALGVMLGVTLVSRLGWRGMFLAIGLFSLLWLVPWCIVAPKLPLREVEALEPPSPSYVELLGKRAVWGTILGLVGANYTWYFFLNWLPYYFERERHYTHDKLALLASLPFWASVVSSMLSGLFADWLIRRGGKPTRVRQAVITTGLAFCCLLMGAAVTVPPGMYTVMLLIGAAAAFGLFSSNHWALSQTLAGPQAAAKWTGLENCFGNMAGVLAAWLPGVVLQATHEFFYAFLIACGILLVSITGFWFVVGKTTHVVWANESPAELSS
jgi:MFS transporter, ACS family, D-galactonate transporter